MCQAQFVLGIEGVPDAARGLLAAANAVSLVVLTSVAHQWAVQAFALHGTFF